MATRFSPIQPAFHDSGVEVFESIGRGSPTADFVDNLMTRPELIQDHAAMTAIFRAYRETALAPVHARHAEELETAETRAYAKAHLDVTKELKVAGEYADTSFDDGVKKGHEECSKTHSHLLKGARSDWDREQKALKSTMRTIETQTDFAMPVAKSAEEDFEARFSAERDELKKSYEAKLGAQAKELEAARARPVLQEERTPVQAKTSSIAQGAFAAMGLAVGVGVTFVATYLSSQG